MTNLKKIQEIFQCMIPFKEVLDIISNATIKLKKKLKSPKEGDIYHSKVTYTIFKMRLGEG